MIAYVLFKSITTILETIIGTVLFLGLLLSFMVIKKLKQIPTHHFHDNTNSNKSSSNKHNPIKGFGKTSSSKYNYIQKSCNSKKRFTNFSHTL